MAWFKVDDKLTDHPKFRRLRRLNPKKTRDIAPLALWVAAGAWSDDGFVPLEVLEDWDDSAEEMAERLVECGLWENAERDGEPGYAFHDWLDMNPANSASIKGSEGNHLRWHVGRGMEAPDCQFCDPDIGATRPRHRGDIGGESGGESPVPSRPDPSRPVPTIESPAKVKKRGTQLPKDWQPSTSVLDAIRDELPNLDLAYEHRRFVDYNLAHGRVMKDWDAAWRNWMRKAVDYAKPKNPTRQQQTDDLFEAAARRMGVVNNSPTNSPTVVEGEIA